MKVPFQQSSSSLTGMLFSPYEAPECQGRTAPGAAAYGRCTGALPLIRKSSRLATTRWASPDSLSCSRSPKRSPGRFQKGLRDRPAPRHPLRYPREGKERGPIGADG